MSTKKTIDTSAMLGAVVMASFAVIAASRWFTTHYIFFLLVCARDILFAIFLLQRRPATVHSSRFQSIFAYATTFVPLCYLADTSGDAGVLRIASLLSILGFLLATLATIELGVQVGVSPARRGEKCSTGVYRVLRHPMYVGYAIAEAGWVLINPVNLLIYAVSMAMQFTRSRWEERIISANKTTGDQTQKVQLTCG